MMTSSMISPYPRRLSPCVGRGGGGDCTFFYLRIFFLFLCMIGLGVLLDGTNGNYRVSCCGVIDAWEFYVKNNPGTVDLQVWRSTGGGSYTLVGENSRTVDGKKSCLWIPHEVVFSFYTCIIFHERNTRE